MGNRIAGIGSLTVDGRQLAVRANMVIQPDPVERTGIAGQDRVHGYSEMPRVPSIEADCSLQPDLAIEDLAAYTNASVVAALADGRIFVLREAWYRMGSEVNSQEGQFRVRFEGNSCTEVQ